MWVLYIILLIAVLYNNNRINQLEEQIIKLRRLLRQGDAEADFNSPVVTKEQRMPVVPPAIALPMDIPPIAKEIKPEFEKLQWEDELPISRKNSEAAQTKAKEESAARFEFNFGARLPVWAGGVALAFAAFYLVKYSIDMGLLGPAVRTSLGGVFGLALLLGGHKIRAHDKIANGVRIAQAVTGAGIAALYASIYAATEMYHFFPAVAGFIAMAAVTALAVVLSVRHGKPIALLGMLGGYLTPLLVGTAHVGMGLVFSYLTLLALGLFAMVLLLDWWSLALPTVVLAGIWALYGVGGAVTDSLTLGMYVLAFFASSSAVALKGIQSGKLSNDKAILFTAVTMAWTLLVMIAMADKIHFTAVEWSMYGLLSAGGLALNFYAPQVFGYAPWVMLLVNVVQIAAWKAGAPAEAGQREIAHIIMAFAALFTGGGLLLMRKSSLPQRQAVLALGAAIAYYLLAYVKIHLSFGGLFHDLSGGIAAPKATTSSIEVLGVSIWGGLAMAIAAGALLLLKDVLLNFKGEETARQKLLAVFALGVTVFSSLGLTVELQREFLSVAFALQVLAVAWLHTRFDIHALPRLAKALAVVFALLLVPQILLLASLTLNTVFGAEINLTGGVPIVNWPLFQLGTPALCFALASLYFRRKAECEPKEFVRVLEVATIALVGVMAYYLNRHAFHPNQDVLFIKATLIERGVMTNALFLYGLLCLWLGQRFRRSAVSASGAVVVGVALFRVVWFDLLFRNPLWTHESVGDVVLFNGLLLPYLLPILWMVRTRGYLVAAGRMKLAEFIGLVNFILAFVWTSMSVRQAFHGGFLDGAVLSHGEIYAYSAAWLVLGIVLQFYGALRKVQAIRIASLVLIALTSAKVFLYDAAALTGLYRVFSFLGLGVSLLGLSWFSTRFVLNKKKED